MWTVKLKTLKDYSIKYDRRKKLPADALMVFGAVAGALAALVSAVYILTGELSFAKNLPEFLNKIILGRMAREPVLSAFFEDDGKASIVFISLIVFGALLIVWGFGALFIKKKKIGITTLCFMLIFSISVGGLYPLGFTEAADKKLGSMVHALKAAVDSRRFDKGEPVCEGDFTAKAGLGLSGDPALEVKMKKPQPYYLKGFVGESYNGGGWSGLSPAVLIDYNDIFMGLHEADFDGRCMAAGVKKILTPGNETNLIEVKNTGSNKRYFYLPYEISVLNSESIGYIGDSCYISGDPEKSSAYSFYAADYFVGSVSEMRKELAEKQGEAAVKDFLKNEYNYRVFCIENYTDLPDMAAISVEEFLEDSGVTITKKLLDGSGEPGTGDSLGSSESSGTGDSLGSSESSGAVDSFGASGDRNKSDSFEHSGELGSNALLSVAAIKKIILENTKDFKYDENIVYSEENGDFIADFLNNKSGYSIHFSTLAAAVFRYYGVPARFVEGYIITEEDIEGKGADEVIELTQGSYHTWAEYYEDGVGWVPFEATPRYIGLMESDSNIASSDAGGSREEVKRPKPEKKKHNILTNKEGEINKAASIILILLIFLAAYLAFRLIKALKKNIRAGGYSLRDMNSEDYRHAIFAIMYHIRRIEKKRRLDSGLLAEAIRIYEEARYSNHEITREMRSEMRKLYEEMKKPVLPDSVSAC